MFQSVIIKQEKSSLLKRGKFYRKSIDDACASCVRGKCGCCVPHLKIRRNDFQMSFSSHSNVQRLFATRIFLIRIGLGVNQYTEIRLKRRFYEGRGTCVLWTENGCRLDYDVRPSVCRYQGCTSTFKEFNVEEKRSPFDSEPSFSDDEIKVMAYVLLDMNLSFEDIGQDEYETLDWDYILEVL